MGLLDLLEHPSHLPLIGSLFGTTPEQDKLKQQIANLEGVYKAYRPQIAHAQMQGLDQRLNTFGPVNNLIGEIEGHGGMNSPFFNLSQLEKNPLTAPGSPLAPPAPAVPPTATTAPMDQGPMTPMGPWASLSPAQRDAMRNTTGLPADPGSVPPYYHPGTRGPNG